MIIDKLVRLGLTENEARLYEYLLDSYKAKASELAKHLGVTHPAVKKMIDSLLEKGLIKSQNFGKTRYYFLEETRNLTKYVERANIKSIEDGQVRLKLAKEAERLVGGKELLSKDSETQINFFKGRGGVDELAKEISQSTNKTALEFTDLDLVIYNSSKDTVNYKKAYKDNGINFDVIYTSRSNKEFDFELNKDQRRLDNQETVSPTAHMIIFDNKVSFSFITDDKAFVIIENKWIANTLRTLFLATKKRLQENN